MQNSPDWSKEQLISDRNRDHDTYTAELHSNYGDQLASKDFTITVLVAFVVFFGTLVCSFCCYKLLQNRGMLLNSGKKGSNERVTDANDFSSVSSDSPVKTPHQLKKDAYRARQVPADSITSFSSVDIPDAVRLPKIPEEKV